MFEDDQTIFQNFLHPKWSSFSREIFLKSCYLDLQNAPPGTVDIKDYDTLHLILTSKREIIHWKDICFNIYSD